MARIKVLDEQLANQIAAGEVVERPSSVVKELVENAVDAGSTSIDVTIEEGGLTLIRVVDNGSGIEGDDLPTAFQRHATSKISVSSDLFRIASLGFRGEALPSIAAVSRLTCVSATDGSGLARRLVIEGGSTTAFEPANAPQGTDMTVRDLFYNTPARLKYMKSIQTELGHISDYMNRVALAHPGIAITLTHNGNVLLRTLGTGDRLQVIAAVYGTSTAKAMLRVEASDPDYEVTGYVSKPELTRANRNGITVIVNGRYIRSHAVNQSLLQAFHTLLPINRFPLAIIEIGMHPGLLDVNVHPSKMEVRFSKEAELRSLIERSVKDVLTSLRHIPGPTSPGKRERSGPTYVQDAISFHIADRLEDAGAASARGPQERPAAASSAGAGASAPNRSWSNMGYTVYVPVDAAERLYSPPAASAESVPAIRETAAAAGAPYAAERTYTERQPSRQPEASEVHPFAPAADTPKEHDSYERVDENFESMSVLVSGEPEAAATAAPQAAQEKQETREKQEAFAASSKPAADADPQQPSTVPDVPSNESARTAGALAFPELHWIGQHHGTYIVAQSDDGLYLIDQHAAHERINYEYYLHKFGNPVAASQGLIVPLTLEFTAGEAAQLRECIHLFAEAGVEIEPFGTQTFLVRAYPEWLPQGEEKAVIEEMAELLIEERKSINIAKLREKAAIMCSCKASIKANDRLSREEGDALLARLSRCEQPYTCPHGRPIIVHLSTYQLEKMFKRVMS